MLSVVALAFLINGCTSFPHYDPAYKTWFDNFHTEDVFPKIMKYRGNFIIDAVVHEVHGTDYNGLDFKVILQDGTGVQFLTAERKKFVLTSILFVFPFNNRDYPKIVFEFKSTNPNLEWTVTSPMYKPPQEGYRILAKGNSIQAKGLAQNVVHFLAPGHRRVSFEAKWIRSVLDKTRPKCTGGTNSNKEFAGIPVVVFDKVVDEMYDKIGKI